MTIIYTFEYWCPEFEKSIHLVEIIINYKNLKYFVIIQEFSYY